ncbi:MAG: COG1361 S-layer family protein [Halanaeroarchaeum sp.]
MNGRLLVAFVGVTVVLATVPAPVAAAEDPRFETTVAEPRLTPGAENLLTVSLVNDAEDVDDRVTTAHNVKVEATGGGTPFEVISGTRRVGTMPDGEPRAVSIRLVVPRSAPAGEYRVPLAVTYEYDGDERETTTAFARVTVPERPTFEVRNVSDSSIVGETASVTLTLQNDGSATAYDSTLRFASTSSSIGIEGTSTATRHVGIWPAGENRTVTIDVTTLANASPAEYPISVTPTYRDDDGVESSYGQLLVGLTPAPRQSFALEAVTTTGYGDTILVEATITNDGSRTVRNALATVSTTHPDVVVTDGTSSVGTLGPGESAAVSFELRRTPDATAKERTFAAAVRYQREDERWYRSAAVPFRVDLPAATDVLEIEPVNNTFGIDESNTFTVRVTNAGDEPLTDLHARLGVRPPYDSNAPTSYVSTLDPGESALLSFEVTTPEDAVPTTDALPITVNATTAEDRRVTSGPTLVAIHVVGADGAAGNTTNLLIGAFAVVVILVAGWWWLNQ